MSKFYTIGHLEIPQYNLKNKPLWYFDSNNQYGIRDIFKKLKLLTGYGFDNDHLQWSNVYGHLFSINIYLGFKCWEISLWDHTGTTILCTIFQDIINKESDIISDENYNILCEKSENFVHDIVCCSDCNTKIKKSEIGGRYFAGIYCNKCWNDKWKDIEAKETYN